MGKGAQGTAQGTVEAGKPRSISRTAIRYDGEIGPLFTLHLTNLVLSLLTAGVYGFWGRTRIRRYILSHISLRDDRFAYHGRGLELFLSWLIWAGLMGLAALICHSYAAGIVDELNRHALRTHWISWMEPHMVVTLNLLLLVLFVLHPFGQYRALRYRLSRISWRGVRFDLSGYSLVYALIYHIGFVINACFLFLLTPLWLALLDRYRFGNICFGNRKARFRLRQEKVPFFSFYLFWLVTFVMPIVAVIFTLGAWGLGMGDMIESLIQTHHIRNAPDAGTALARALDSPIVMLTMVGLIVVSLLTRLWFRYGYMRFVLANARVGIFRVMTKLNFLQFSGLVLLHMLLVGASFGIGLPLVWHLFLEALEKHFRIGPVEELDAVVPEDAPNRPDDSLGQGLLHWGGTGPMLFEGV